MVLCEVWVNGENNEPGRYKTLGRFLPSQNIENRRTNSYFNHIINIRSCLPLISADLYPVKTETIQVLVDAKLLEKSPVKTYKWQRRSASIKSIHVLKERYAGIRIPVFA